MCGIVGYIGYRQAPLVIMDGLKRLEYRGYDSAGICFFDNGFFKLVKSAGEIENLQHKLKGVKLGGEISIGHTRWATHGEPNEINAHPHADCHNNIFVVHNGIIENYLNLKKQLLQKGHVFRSDTDTEVIAHLIEDFIKQGENLENSVKKTLKAVKGAYAILALSQKEPDKIVAARLSSPLRIGVGNNEFIIASDPTAIINYTKEIITLNDFEIAVVKKNDFKISLLDDIKNQAIKKEIEKIDWDIEAVQKEGHKHYMIKEIFEQPRAIVDAYRGRLIAKDGMVILGGLKQVEEKLRRIKKIHIVACGTAYHSGLVGKYMLEEYAGIDTEVSVASEFRYRQTVINPQEEAVLVISQSGETADTLAVAQDAKNKGILTLGIVNVVGSSIARVTDAGVYNHAGPEIGVASTKAFTTQLVIFCLLTIYLGRMRKMSLVMGQRIAKELLSLPDKIKEVLSRDNEILNIAKRYKSCLGFYFLGRKYNYPLALEGALKLKEISYIHSEGLPAGELKHGPLALICQDFPSVYICPTDSVYDKNYSNIQEIKSRGGKIIVIATTGNFELSKVVNDIFYIPKTLEMLTPILVAIPLQLLAYHISEQLGFDADKPRNLAKSVTVE